VRALAVIGCVAALVLPAASAAAPAPKLADPTATGRSLVIRFFVLLQHKDKAGLQTFLSPAFQVQRADGSSSGKEAYLANLPTVNKFYLSNLAATQAGGTLVVRYLARAEGLVNGKPYTPGPAPRLSVFAWSGEHWQLAAHANFNPLTG
jgi:hypothetical protein